MVDTTHRVGAASTWSAFWQIFVQPGSALAAVAEKPAIAPVYLLLMAMQTLGVILMMPLMMTQIEVQPELRTGVIGGAVIGGLASPWIGGFIAALVAKFFGTFEGGAVRIRSYMAVLGYAYLPAAIGGLIQSVMATQATSLEAATRVSLSPVIFLGPDAGLLVRAVVSSMNPFAIWSFVLIAIGFGAIHRVPAARGASLAGTLFVIGALSAMLGLSMG